jgi:hypothetical protein
MTAPGAGCATGDVARLCMTAARCLTRPACRAFHLAYAVHVGVDVELRHVIQEGTSPRRRKTKSVRRLVDPGGRFDALLHRVQHRGRTPMLDRIDPIKDLELTSSEMSQLLEELVVAEAEVNSPAERSVVLELRVLAEECGNDPRLTLNFVGD